MSELVLVLCLCVLLSAGFYLLARRGNAVHSSMFLAMLRAARELGMGEIVILSEPRAPKGFVYVLEKRNLDSLHLIGDSTDVTLTGTLAHRFFDQYPDISEYRYQLRVKRPFDPNLHVVIKNLTDGGQ